MGASVQTQPPPPGWGEDLLTKYYDDARKNSYATYDNTTYAKRLVEIDAQLHRGTFEQINPRPAIPMLFLLRAFSSYRAATMLAMAGAAFETMPVLRSSLEMGAYGIHIGADEALFEIWLNRADGDDQRNKMIEEFKLWRIRKKIKEMSPKLEQDFHTLYEMLIENGGHPNVTGFMGSSQMVREADRTHYNQIQLHGWGTAHELAMLQCRRIGMWLLSVYGILYKTRWDLLGINEAAARFRAEHQAEAEERIRARGSKSGTS